MRAKRLSVPRSGGDADDREPYARMCDSRAPGRARQAASLAPSHRPVAALDPGARDDLVEGAEDQESAEANSEGRRNGSAMAEREDARWRAASATPKAA